MNDNKIIDGKMVSGIIKNRLKEEVEKLKENDVKIGLAVIIVGEDKASRIYVNNKKRTCEELGIYSEEHALPENVTMDEMLELIDDLNEREEISGILVQLPIPKHLDESKIISRISPLKDVDAFHPVNVGKIMVGNFDFVPCTPAGIMELLKYYNVDISGKHCVVIGRSNIVGKPMAMLLLKENGTVTICHSKTKNLKEITKTADIIVVAVGKKDFFNSDMVKEGAVVIDVGINRRSEDNKICGDVNFNDVYNKVSLITPVPGGVGPMTISMLMKNTINAAKLNSKRKV